MQYKGLLDEGSVDNIIDEIVKLNKAQRFASELSHTADTERKSDIQEIIKMLDGVSRTDFQTIGKSKMDKIYENINEHTLHGKWSKLSIPQKKQRIDIYLNENIKKENKKIDAKKLLHGLIDIGKLKKNHIDYDQTECKIKSIKLEGYNKIINETESSNSSNEEDTEDDNCSNSKSETDSNSESESD